MFWFLCVANVYIDPVKKHQFVIGYQTEMLMETTYLYTETSCTVQINLKKFQGIVSILFDCDDIYVCI